MEVIRPRQRPQYRTEGAVSVERAVHPGQEQVVPADAYPFVSEERARAEEAADYILQRNLETPCGGEELDAPEVDAIGSARRVLAAQHEFGPDSLEYKAALEYLDTDAERYISEVMRAKTWEYFGSLEHGWEDGVGVTTFGLTNRAVFANGLSPFAHPEEVQRRRNEYVENETHRAMVESGLAESFWCLTVSMCTYGDVAGYEQSSQKMMIRGMHFDTDEAGNCRGAVSEQLAVKGHIFTDAFMNHALVDMGVIDAHEQLDRTAIHKTQIFIPEGTFADVIDFTRYLDALAGGNVFLGEEAGEFGYEDVKQQAARRRSSQQSTARKVRERALKLAKDGVDPDVATARLHDYVDHLAHDMCSKYPEITPDVFDEQTWKGYVEAQSYRAAGKHGQAEKLQQQVRASAPGVAACGSGSCGLEKCSIAEASALRATRLQTLKGGGYLKDTKRACKKCGKKRITYGANGSICGNCGTRKINGRLTYRQK